VLIVDKLLVSGLKFVLGKVSAAVVAELNDDSHLREELLAAQMRLELGELSSEEFAALETDILVRLRDIRARKQGAQPTKPGEFKVTGAEATTYDSKE
jgi:hypothetical protein